MRDFFLFQIIIIAAASMLSLVKTVHYTLTIRRKNLLNWFYFNFYSIVNSQTEQTERAKKIQNKFTLFIVVLLLIVLSSIFINKALQHYFPDIFTTAEHNL
jgi:hypothetical protein